MHGLRELVLIHDLKKQGLSLTAIARKVGCDRKTVRKYLERGLEAPVYGPRQPRDCLLDPYEDYLRERVMAFPDLSGARLLREIREMGYEGGYTRVTDFLRKVRPPARTRFERRFETPPGRQAQVDFAEFTVSFTDEPDITRKVWLFSIILGHSRWLWGRFVASQNLQSVLRCHAAAFEAMGGVPEELLYDRMKTAVIGEDAHRRPDLSWRVRTLNREDCISLFVHGGADLLLCYEARDFPPLPFDASVERRVWRGDTLIPIVGGSLRQAIAEDGALRGPVPLLSYPSDSHFGRLLSKTRLEDAFGESAVGPRVESAFSVGLFELIIRGAGVGWIPHSMCRARLSAGDVVSLAHTYGAIPLDITLFALGTNHTALDMISKI